MYYTCVQLETSKYCACVQGANKTTMSPNTLLVEQLCQIEYFQHTQDIGVHFETEEYKESFDIIAIKYFARG